MDAWLDAEDRGFAPSPGDMTLLGLLVPAEYWSLSERRHGFLTLCTAQSIRPSHSSTLEAARPDEEVEFSDVDRTRHRVGSLT